MRERTDSLLERFSNRFDATEFLIHNEEMSYEEYLQRVQENPRLARNAFQYIYDMIVSKGYEEFERYRRTYKRYKFFSEHPQYPIFGLEPTLEDLVEFVRGAAGGYGAERRILLLHGPVGSSKSTICRAIKSGLEMYSRTPEGAWYTYKWVNLPYEGHDALYITDECEAAMNENPLKLMPEPMRNEFLEELNKIFINHFNGEYRLVCEGTLNPRCQFFFTELMKRYNGDWIRVMRDHIRVIRKCHSEVNRIGIGTFQPKDEKNQDSTELTGDLNYRKIGHFGSDSDPRAFDFDGEFEVANRGFLEFIEMLKLSKEFLYDLLGAAQEHQIKPKKFSQVYIDEMIAAHTNNPEYEKLRSDKHMEALRDRTVKIDVPYLLRWSDELKILEHMYGPGKVKQHIMPHTLEIAAFFAVLTRLQEDPNSSLSLRDKVKLYDGRILPGWTEDKVRELHDRFPEEGMKWGVSARYIQDKISACLARYPDYVNVFHVMNEIRDGLRHSSLISNVEDIKRYDDCVSLAIQELDDILKNEVQRALVADENAIERLCNKYIDNITAYINNEKVRNPITDELVEPDERLMRSIEEKIGVVEQACDDFRRSIVASIGTMARRGQEFRWDSNPQLKTALEKKLFEDTRDTIKLSSLTKEAAEIDPDLQEKIEAVKTRLIKQYGYNEKSATDVLEYVSSILARGDANEE